MSKRVSDPRPTLHDDFTWRTRAHGSIAIWGRVHNIGFVQELFRNCSPNGRKLWLYLGHRLELQLSIGYPVEPLSCTFREACKVPKICVQLPTLGNTCICGSWLGDLFIEFSRDIFALLMRRASEHEWTIEKAVWSIVKLAILQAHQAKHKGYLSLRETTPQCDRYQNFSECKIV